MMELADVHSPNCGPAAATPGSSNGHGGGNGQATLMRLAAKASKF
jgi:hypothetical protein